MSTALLSILIVGVICFGMRTVFVFRFGTGSSDGSPSASAGLSALVAPAAFATIATTNVLGQLSSDAGASVPLLTALAVTALIVRRTGSTTLGLVVGLSIAIVLSGLTQ